MTKEFNSAKPEWFQLVDSDAPSAQVTKVNKKIPAIAAVVAGAIIAGGSFFASTSGESQAVAQTLESNVVTSSAPTQITSTPAPVKSAIKVPSQGGVKAPTGRDDEGDDDHEGRGDSDRD
jgi:hypothetical protein